MWHRFYEKKVIRFCLRKTISGSYLKQNNSDLVFQTRTIFLKWVSTQLVTWPKCVIFKVMNYLFLNTNFALKLKGKSRKDDVVTFTAHLSVNIKCLTRYKQRVVLAAIRSPCRHVGGQEYALKHGGQCKSYYFVEKSKCHKISALSILAWTRFQLIF